MEVDLHPSLRESLLARQAATATEACVHCGFCLETCPTYLDSRDERDSPRGRIYLVRELLQQGTSDTAAQRHLDRCLGCRACETTCPSGVRYGEIADTGRALLEMQLPRPWHQRWLRGLLRRVVPYPARFTPLLRSAQALRSFLPQRLRRLVPARQQPLPQPPRREHARRVVLLEGCVQSSATPRTNEAARLVLDRLGIEVVATPAQGCCGALDTHLGHLEAGKVAMRRNIDAWTAALDSGVEAVLSTATGCGAELSVYGQALADDPAYAARARRLSELARDLGQFLAPEPLAGHVKNKTRTRVAVHAPCSQTHVLHSAATVREILSACGYELTETRDDHLCCGSAGSYSLLQPGMAGRLRTRKLEALSGGNPSAIATANVGCQMHLNAGSAVPVIHWVELVWEAMDG